MALDDLGAVMDAISTTITAGGLAPRAYPYPAETISVPCAVVGYPERIDFDVTYQRGADQATLPVYFVVGRASEASARTALSAVIADASSIKSALDGNLGGAVDSCRVLDMRVLSLTVAGIDYLAGVFDTEVVA